MVVFFFLLDERTGDQTSGGRSHSELLLGVIVHQFMWGSLHRMVIAANNLCAYVNENM